LVRVLSLAMSSSWGNVWSGGLERSGMGQRRTVESPPADAIEWPRESRSIATAVRGEES
jgi:hypothetical protein